MAKSFKEEEFYERSKAEWKYVAFVLGNFDYIPFRKFFNDNVEDINNLIGPHQIIMSTKKNANIGDVLFSGKKFSGTQVRSNATRPCSKRCLTCPLLALPSQVTLENKSYTLYQDGSCKSEDIIYACVCNICNDISYDLFFNNKTCCQLVCEYSLVNFM